MSRQFQIPFGAALAIAAIAVLSASSTRGQLFVHAAPPCPASDPASSAIAIDYAGLETRLTVSPAFVLPGDTLELKVAAPSGAGVAQVRASAGVLAQIDPTRWRWQAPRQPGSYDLEVVPGCGSDSMTVRAFVMVPDSAVHRGYLNGFHIGLYPNPPARREATYRPPAGFVEVTPQNEDVFLTPHFRLRQFLTKQPGGFPKYVVIDPRLLLKLEHLEELVQADGYGRLGPNVMSGYRTPVYNRSLGNVPFSRHLYGAAADIFIDEHPRDGVMDDLNKDGRIDIRDAAVLYDLIDRHRDDPVFRAFVGGLAMYPATAAHGPFVHIDVRGYRARW
jgi:hypothetical protein